VEPLVVVGEPVEAILNEADRIDADLIIVGNHALSGFKHLMHHNIGEKIVRLSKRPVLSFYIGEE
jgi:nucleotide-binding universal stress UspA family protein